MCKYLAEAIRIYSKLSTVILGKYQKRKLTILKPCAMSYIEQDRVSGLFHHDPPEKLP